MTSFSQRVRPVTREPYKWEKDAGGPASDMNAETNREQIDIFVRALFKHAMPGSCSLRSFHDDESTKSFAIECLQVDDHDRIVDAAYRQASRAAAADPKIVFCPPIATFSNNKHAGKDDVANGLTLSAECDKHPQQARATLEKLLGPATIVVASGGESANPDTGEIEPKLHLHWRLQKPARGDDRKVLEQARRFVIEIVASDPNPRAHFASDQVAGIDPPQGRPQALPHRGRKLRG